MDFSKMESKRKTHGKTLFLSTRSFYFTFYIISQSPIVIQNNIFSILAALWSSSKARGPAGRGRKARARRGGEGPLKTPAKPTS